MDSQDFPLKIPDFTMLMPEPTIIDFLYSERPEQNVTRQRLDLPEPIKADPSQANILKPSIKGKKLVPLPPTKADLN